MSHKQPSEVESFLVMMLLLVCAAIVPACFMAFDGNWLVYVLSLPGLLFFMGLARMAFD